MPRIGRLLPRVVNQIPGIDKAEFWKQRRAHQVQDIWARTVNNSVLAHTNSVFIFTKNGRRQMHVYVDQSAYAAELNMRSQLIKAHIKLKSNENIDEFHAHVSRGTWRNQHPYAKLLQGRPLSMRDAPALNARDKDLIDQSVAKIHDPRLARAFKEAMTSDLRMKKTYRW